MGSWAFMPSNVRKMAANEVATQCTDGWASLQPQPAGGAGAGLQLVEGRFFVKGDSGWCRNGNAEINLAQPDDSASAADASESARQARQSSLSGDGSAGWSDEERRRFREELSSILLRQLVVDHAGAVHLQPCIRALTGRSEEFRGFVLNGAPFL